jgi:hypothetical protein
MKGFTKGFTGVSQGFPGGQPGPGSAQPKNGTQSTANAAAPGKRKFVPIRKLASAGSGFAGKPAFGAKAIGANISVSGSAKSSLKKTPPKVKGASKVKSVKQTKGNLKGVSSTPGPFQGFGGNMNNSNGGYGF